jgi:hypothetical protein
MSTGKSWRVQLIGPLVCAATIAGCAASKADEGRQAQQAAGTAGEAGATVSLSGCVEAAPGPRQYVLKHVRFEPRESGDPHIDTTTAGAYGITQGAWVRLRDGGQDLATQTGRRVTVLGTITDSGRNAIGTSGTEGVRTPSGDKSMAASREHYWKKVQDEAGRIARESIADGTAAEVLVQKVEASGEKCPLEVKPEAP